MTYCQARACSGPLRGPSRALSGAQAYRKHKKEFPTPDRLLPEPRVTIPDPTDVWCATCSPADACHDCHGCKQRTTGSQTGTLRCGEASSAAGPMHAMHAMGAGEQ